MALSRNENVVNVAFIQSEWHAELVDQARIGFAETIADAANVTWFSVPGAFEIPLQAQVLAQTGDFDAIVAAGFVIDGGIYRHEFVAEAVISGLMRVQLDTGVPVFSCVLTPQQFHEHEAHQSFFFEHLKGKGAEAARACIAIIELRRSFLQGDS